MKKKTKAKTNYPIIIFVAVALSILGMFLVNSGNIYKVSITGAVVTVGSCEGRCASDNAYIETASCQCDSYCTNYGDCCSDYQAKCVTTTTATTGSSTGACSSDSNSAGYCDVNYASKCEGTACVADCSGCLSSCTTKCTGEGKYVSYCKGSSCSCSTTNTCITTTLTTTVATTCTGGVFLALNPNIVNPNAVVTATTSGLSGCDNKQAQVWRANITNAPVCTCQVSGTGCSCNFVAPNLPGNYSYISTVDKDGNNQLGNIPGEVSPAVPLFVEGVNEWCWDNLCLI